MKHIISLGAGVQSSSMALMAAHGEIIPMPDAAIFADTQAEPSTVYEWLNWLEKRLPFPIYRVSKGRLAEAALKVRTSKSGSKYMKSTIPAFVIDSKHKVGLMRRQCTFDFKVEIIQKEIRRLRKNKEQIIQWMGISLDEAHRMKPSRVSYVNNIYPLVDRKITRDDCLNWMKKQGYPEFTQCATPDVGAHAIDTDSDSTRKLEHVWTKIELAFRRRWNGFSYICRRPNRISRRVVCVSSACGLVV